MGRQYSPKTFLRKVPNKLLNVYFSRYGGLPEVEFDKLAENHMEPVFEAILKLPPKTQTRIEANFHQINELAFPIGTRAILEEAAMGLILEKIGAKATEGDSSTDKAKWPGLFAVMKNDYERAFWTFLDDLRVFEVASDLIEMDRIGSWKKWPVGKVLTPAVKESIQPFTDEICEFFRPQGRGQHCHVENYLRQTPERHCYFVYPADYPSTEPGYDEAGAFGEQQRRPAIEMIFVYRPETGMLETSASGKREDVEALLDIFCRTILGLPKLPPRPSEPAFDLMGLKKRDFPHATEVQDAINLVCIKKLRLDLPGMGGRRIILEASASKTKPDAVYDLLDVALNKERVPVDTLFLSQVKFQFVFAPRGGKREKKLTFEVSHPDRCTLKDDPHDQIAKKYLKLWKIARE
jgi:hypothetical protein